MKNRQQIAAAQKNITIKAGGIKIEGINNNG